MGKTEEGRGAVIALRGVRRMRHDPRIEQVIAYWEALRNGRPAPLRAEIDPRGMEGALDRVFLAERIAPGIARIRLAGMALNDLMGMEVRGMPMSALMAPAERARLSEALEWTFAGGVRTHLRLAAAKGFNRPELHGEMLLLPLGIDRHERPLVLGCLVTGGRIGHTPRRLEITEVAHQPFAIPRPAAEAPAPASAPGVPPRPTHAADRAKGFSEPPAPAFSAPHLTRGRPRLRVVATNDSPAR